MRGQRPHLHSLFMYHSTRRGAEPGPTCRGRCVQPLQAAPLACRVAPGLGEAPLTRVQYGGGRDEARGQGPVHASVQLLHLSLLNGLEALHLQQLPAGGGREVSGWSLLLDEEPVGTSSTEGLMDGWMDGLVYLSRSSCNSAHSSLSLSDSSEVTGTGRLRDWFAAGLLAGPSHRPRLTLRPAPSTSSPSAPLGPSPSGPGPRRSSQLSFKLGAVRTLHFDELLLSVLLSELSDWLGVGGGGEWAVGEACHRGRGCWAGPGASVEGVTWKRPTVMTGVFFFAARSKRVSQFVLWRALEEHAGPHQLRFTKPSCPRQTRDKWRTNCAYLERYRPATFC